MPYYAVARGRTTGVFNIWSACKDQVDGYSGAIYRKFDNAGSAHDFLESYGCSSSSCSGGHDGSFDIDIQGFVIVYTDGACLSNGTYGARAGIGVYWGDGHPLNISEPVYGRQTNNTAEIQAATRAMNIAANNGIRKLNIVTDSKFLIDSITKWMPGWKQNGWRVANGGPVRNEQDFRALDQAQKRLNVKWTHVEAHHGNIGNEMADQLAKEGASMA